MNTSSLGAWLASCCLLASAGCSSTPKPQPIAPATTAAASAPPRASEPSRASTTPATTQIRVDDAILKACGIKADTAFFAFDSAKLEPDASGTLTAIAKCFASGPLKGKTLRLVGHADPRGEYEYNMVLGQSRADAVGSFLERRGLDKGLVSTTSRGAMDAKGHDETGWAGDRRVDLLLGS
jgi:peptidoglycan-associated lipoprotein